MTKKTRNWLITLGILAFPLLLFLGCLVFMKEPPKANPDETAKTPLRGPATGTNVISP